MRETNLKIVETVLEKGAAGKLDELSQYFHTDWVCVEADSLPYSGTFKGFEGGYLRLMKEMLETWDDLSWDIKNIIADDHSVVVLLDLKGRLGDQTFDMPVCEVWEFRDGKIVRSTPYYFDTKIMSDIYEASK